MRTIKYIGLCFLVIVAHSTIVKLFSIGSIRPDLLIFILIYISMKEGSFAGVCVGFCIGLLQDVYMPSSLGVNCFAKSIIGFSAGFLNEKQWRTDIWVRSVVILISFLIHDSIVFLLRYGSFMGIWSSLGLITLPSAVYTLAIWMVIWIYLKRKGQPT